MYTTTMVTDEWDGARNDECEVEFPSLDQVEQAVKHLDAERHSLVTLEAGGEAHMAIGGGGGRFIVYATFDNETFHNLLAGGDSEQMVTLFVGGQDGEYPAKTVVSEEAALTAAKTFAESGKLDPALSWEEQ